MIIHYNQQLTKEVLHLILIWRIVVNNIHDGGATRNIAYRNYSRDAYKEVAQTQQVMVLLWLNDKEPTVHTIYMYFSNKTNYRIISNFPQYWKDIFQEAYLTWRPWGIEGAGKENLPRAATAWKSQRGENTILPKRNKKNRLMYNHKLSHASQD